MLNTEKFVQILSDKWGGGGWKYINPGEGGSYKNFFKPWYYH